ncbi:hypothetical protein F2Q69_00020757 [Brassica cretica]|uniref:DUF4283 domain-containing protein n=1 Tax=Brassica cretica TaxID=69181 RepID=A0A8S9Q8E5_BRACR|nr:hypothetical protein F2Q69_00020757 [Brassica cretica]
MLDRDWDPGAKRNFTIRGESYGDGKSWGFSGDLRIKNLITSSTEFQLKRVWNGDTIGFFRKWLSFRSLEWMRNLEDQAQELRGMNFVIIKTRSLPSVIESGNIIMRYDNYKKDTWLLDRIFFGILGCRNRFLDDWNWDSLFISITVSSMISYDLNCSLFLLLALAIMTQAQLVGKSGDGKSGEGNDDRARSYKGVVTNGEGGHQENDKNPRRYQGKGKGKMYEEQESKWERVPEGRSKRSFSNRNHNKFEEGGSRNRNSRWEKTRRHSEEERSRPSRATRSERNPLRGERSPVRRSREEPREEGEIWLDESDRGRLQQEVEKSLIPPPGPAQETSPLPGDPDQVTLITGELENGLDLVSEFLEDGTNTLEQDKIIADLDFSGEVGMELGETDHTRTETESGLELDDEFQNLRDREGKDMNQVEAKEVVEEDMTGDIVEGKGATAAEKKPGLRKPLFSVSGGNNSKFAQVLMSPRKRAPAKQSLRKGGGAKQVKEKGSSHPKQLPKP